MVEEIKKLPLKWEILQCVNIDRNDLKRRKKDSSENRGEMSQKEFSIKHGKNEVQCKSGYMDLGGSMGIWNAGNLDL